MSIVIELILAVFFLATVHRQLVSRERLVKVSADGHRR
jgi:hypothetical protein